MKILYELHQKNNAVMGVYNKKSVPSSYHPPEVEYKAVRENVLLVDYSHLSIVSVIGDDAWALVNYLASADVSVIRDEQGIYSLVLNEDGAVRGDIYVLCVDNGYYLLSENIPSEELVDCLENILACVDNVDIQEKPVIKSMEEDDWGALLLEGPYSWEVLSSIYGFDIIGLPYNELMNTDDNLTVFRCSKHGEFAYLVFGEQSNLIQLWQSLITLGDKFLLKTGGIDYQKMVRLEDPGWDESIYAAYSCNPVELQLQWAIQHDKEGFIGKASMDEMVAQKVERKLVGIVPVSGEVEITADDKVFADGGEVGVIVKAGFSPARHSFIALALIDHDYAYADIDGFEIKTDDEYVPAMTQCMPFLYHLSLLVSPMEHSFIDDSKKKSAVQ